MGGLGPGIGGLEYLLIAVVALLVLGPERLPVMLRKIGKMVGKARGMANEFRSSFDEMARQSELDDLRKEVEALRTGQGAVNLGAEADAAFKDIKAELERPVGADAPPMTPAAGEWPDSDAVMTPLTTPAPTPDQGDPAIAIAKAPAKRARAVPAAKTPATAAAKVASKPRAKTPPMPKAAAAKPRAPRQPKPDQ